MSNSLEIAITNESLEHEPGEVEECATHGRLTIQAGEACLSEGIDHYSGSEEKGPLVSGYYLAEWLAWNWWRHRWEPRRQDISWELVHDIGSAEGSYVWPNITVYSDGCRTFLIAKSSSKADAIPFRFTQNLTVVRPASAWEQAVDGFFKQIKDRLDDEGITATNLHALLNDLEAERSDQELSDLRRIEALLGRDPESPSVTDLVNKLIADSEALGSNAVNEIAAHLGQQTDAADVGHHEESAFPVYVDIVEYARKKGISASLPKYESNFRPELSFSSMNSAAWEQGINLAKRLRQEEKFGDGPIEDKYLVEMAGVSLEGFRNRKLSAIDFSFALKGSSGDDRITFRSNYRSGRRFEIARFISDLMISPEDKLHPATSAKTYRQKVQRAFAAELLSPSDAVIDALKGHYEDEDRREGVAKCYGVSPEVIRRQLQNRGLLSRDEWDGPDTAPDAAIAV